MQESLEDRMVQEGKHEQFVAIIDKLERDPHSTEAQQIARDALVDLGADDVEADEFVNMIRDNA